MNKNDILGDEAEEGEADPRLTLKTGQNYDK